MMLSVFQKARVVACALAFTGTATTIGAAQAAADRQEHALTAGVDTYRQFCAPCHGADGKGKGPVAPILLTPPSDLTTIRQRHKGDFPFAALEETLMLAEWRPITAHGSEQMPVWGAVFRSMDTDPALVKARVATLLAYIDSIQSPRTP